jgi:hypothetical protein
MTSPEKEKKIRIMIRQVADAQILAKKIIAGDRNRASVESFARFCTDLNAYIRVNDEREKVLEIINEIPEIQYTLWPNGFWQYLYIPYWVLASQRAIVMAQIRQVREKYERLEPRLRGMNSDMFK